VRGRLITIAIALPVLAFAVIRHADQAPTAQRQSNAAAGQLADPRAPEPDVPAIITAAVNTSATVQTVLVVGSSRQLRPALSVFAVSPHLPVVARSTDKPRFFPLLI
jgi:voltage-gated potassium channel Kch